MSNENLLPQHTPLWLAAGRNRAEFRRWTEDYERPSSTDEVEEYVHGLIMDALNVTPYRVVGWRALGYRAAPVLAAPTDIFGTGHAPFEDPDEAVHAAKAARLLALREDGERESGRKLTWHSDCGDVNYLLALGKLLRQDDLWIMHPYQNEN